MQSRNNWEGGPSERHGCPLGIRNSKMALAYLVMVKETLGDDWLTPDLFRFGASTLVNDVLMQIAKQVDGNYQGADYFSMP